MIQAIFFDFNGVIIDDERIHLRAYREVLLGEDVALKDEDYFASLGMDDPAFVRMTDCGYVSAAGKSRPYLVMDYFDGIPLDDFVKEHGPLAPADVKLIIRPIANGLLAAHGKGILHRDVKPANILVREEEDGWRVKLIDFGLALK